MSLPMRLRSPVGLDGLGVLLGGRVEPELQEHVVAEAVLHHRALGAGEQREPDCGGLRRLVVAEDREPDLPRLRVACRGIEVLAHADGVVAGAREAERALGGEEAVRLPDPEREGLRRQRRGDGGVFAPAHLHGRLRRHLVAGETRDGLVGEDADLLVRALGDLGDHLEREDLPGGDRARRLRDRIGEVRLLLELLATTLLEAGADLVVEAPCASLPTRRRSSGCGA
jgi:hypothetical protein